MKSYELLHSKSKMAPRRGQYSRQNRLQLCHTQVSSKQHRIQILFPLNTIYIADSIFN